MKQVKCKKCGWIHFTVTGAYVKKWQQDWERFWPSLNQESREAYGLPDGPPGPEQYFSCFRCGNNYKDFLDATEEDTKRVYGSTIQPILNKEETWISQGS